MKTNKMKTVLAISLCAFGICLAHADSLLYFMTDAYNGGEPPKYFDYAVMGVADTSGEKVGYLYMQASPDSGAEQSLVLKTDADAPWRATGWADFGAYATEDYVFFVETYRTGDDTPLWCYSPLTAMSYAQLVAANHVYIPGETDPQNVTAWITPEPTGGVLLLLGLASLALRRKQVEG